MNQFLAWLSMGGYSMYVWPAYGLVALVLALNCIGLKWKEKKTAQNLQHWFKR